MYTKGFAIIEVKNINLKNKKRYKTRFYEQNKINVKKRWIRNVVDK